MPVTLERSTQDRRLYVYKPPVTKFT